MLKTILAKLTQGSDTEVAEHAVEIATAAIIFEVVRADQQVDEREIATLKSTLSGVFSLTPEELDTVLSDGKRKSEDAVDLVQFTQIVNQHITETHKQRILKGIWEIAYADNELDPLEEYTIRKIADLLYIPHSQYIKAKLAAQADVADEGDKH